METLNCFDLHDLVLNDDDDIQDAYCNFIIFKWNLLNVLQN